MEGNLNYLLEQDLISALGNAVCGWCAERGGDEEQSPRWGCLGLVGRKSMQVRNIHGPGCWKPSFCLFMICSMHRE